MKKLFLTLLVSICLMASPVFGAAITDKSIGGLIVVLEAGATTEMLVGGGGAGNIPVWTTVTGTGAPVLATTPTLVTPVLGAATGTSLDMSGTISGNLFTPDAADGADIGSAALEFSDIYLADGSIIKFQNDQSVTLTSSATGLTGNLDLQGKTVTAEDSFNPDAANSATLGTVDLEFSDLFLAAGGIIYGEADQGNTLTSSATEWTANLGLTALGNINAGADDDIAHIYIHHAGTLVFNDASDDTTVTLGPVGDGTTNLGITGGLTISAASSLTAGDFTLTNGNLVIGTSGKGIDFSATGDSGGMTNELLDDYEEGTWTPVYTPQTGSFTTMTMEVLTAKYIKIGRRVWLIVNIQTDSVDATGASGDLFISGLPFTVANQSGSGSVTVNYANSWAGDHPLNGTMTDNSTSLKLRYRTSTPGSDLDLDVSDLTAGVTANQNRVMIMGTYTTE